MSFVEKIGRENEEHFTVEDSKNLDQALQNADQASRGVVSVLQKKLWGSAMQVIDGKLKDARWAGVDGAPPPAKKRKHPFANMHLRTVYEWIARRKAYLKAHPAEDSDREEMEPADDVEEMEPADDVEPQLQAGAEMDAGDIDAE